MTLRQQYMRDYSSWSHMKNRCLNPHSSDYYHYGKQGVSIAEEFMTFEGFMDYVLSTIGPRPTRHVLDRIDSDLGYVPGNIRWADLLTHNRNRRAPTSIRRFTEDEIDRILALRLKGVRITDIATRLGVNRTAVDKVLRRFRMTYRRNIA
jgi:Homeodomain-like domain-containing protein